MARFKRKAAMSAAFTIALALGLAAISPVVKANKTAPEAPNVSSVEKEQVDKGPKKAEYSLIINNYQFGPNGNWGKISGPHLAGHPEQNIARYNGSDPDVVLEVNVTPGSSFIGIRVLSTGQWLIGPYSDSSTNHGDQVIQMKADLIECEAVWLGVSEQVTFMSEHTDKGTVSGSASGYYRTNQTVSQTATPKPGYKFAGWRINAASTYHSTSATLTDLAVTGPMQIVAEFTYVGMGAYITIISNAGGTIDKSSGTYPAGEIFTAIPNLGYAFEDWYINGTAFGATEPTWESYQNSGSCTLEAIFTRTHYNFSANIVGGSGLSATSITSSLSNGMHLLGTPYTVNVNQTYMDDEFLGWFDDYDVLLTTSPWYTSTLTDDTALHAKFGTVNNTISFSAETASTGSVSATLNSSSALVSGTGVKPSDTIGLTATPAVGYEFVKWIDADTLGTVSTSASFSFSVTSNTHYIAVFGIASHTFTFEVIDATTGSSLPIGTFVDSSTTPSGTYVYNTGIFAQAVSSIPGYVFSSITIQRSGLPDEIAIPASSAFFTLTADTNVIFYFASVDVAFSAISSDTSLGTVSGTASGSIAHGSPFSVTANPIENASQYVTFDGWYQDGVLVETNTTYSGTVPTTGLHLIAQFTRQSYDLIVNQVLNGGAPTNHSTNTYWRADDTRTISAPALTGYTFDGWYQNGSLVVSSTDVTIVNDSTTDVILEMHYSTSIFTVEFVDWNGTVLDTQTVNYGGAATAPASPTYPGHTFLGWSVSFSVVTSDLTVTAIYDTDTYQVDFLDYDGSTLQTSNVAHGAAATAPADPSRTGYTFTGWDVTFDNITSNTTVTAQYIINTYTVTFLDFDDSVIGTGTATHGGSVSGGPIDPVRTGYTFTGWLGSLDNITADGSVKAQYSINSYTVEFVNWDDTLIITDSVEYGSGATAPADPVRVGYTFTGWDVSFSNITSNLTVTALYSINSYTVNFVDWNGIVIDTQGVDYGSGATAPADPSRTGYTFTGWDVAFNNITGNLTVTAQYSIDSYTVNFVDWNGNSLDTQIVTFGDSATAPANPSRTGYTFTGWDIAFNNITGNTTVTAQYSINNFTVEFVDWNGNVLDTQAVNYGDGATAPADPSRTGYTFVGWNVAFNNITGNLTVTATYTIKSFTVEFVDWNGNVLDTQTVNYGQGATAPADPSRTGYTFTGWDVAFNNITGNLTVTATYTIKTYTVVFEDNEGNVIKTETVNHGGSATAPADPTKMGYDFAGWNGSLTNITGNITFTPTWSISDDDTDGDGVPDYVELVDGTDPLDENSYKDTDGDGVPDYVEENDGTDPNDKNDYKDSDGDGVPDYIEEKDGTDPDDKTSYKDTDGDKVPDYIEEVIDNTDPNDRTDVKDSDGDGVPDYVEEVIDGTNPNDKNDFLDTDGDEVPDYVEEIIDNTDPNDKSDFLDTDGDGVPDYVEGIEGTDPNDADSFLDTDNDGLADYVEKHVIGTDPTNPDTDGDGLSDGEEVNVTHTNPLVADSDGDGYTDGEEIDKGTNPNDPHDYPKNDDGALGHYPLYIAISTAVVLTLGLVALFIFLVKRNKGGNK